MTQKSMMVTVSPTGETKVDMQGFNGVGCKDASKSLLDAITGMKAHTADTQNKPEFWQAQANVGLQRG